VIESFFTENTDFPHAQKEKREILRFDYEVQTSGNRRAEEERNETSRGR
jgi:hypothetical protein